MTHDHPEAVSTEAASDFPSPGLSVQCNPFSAVLGRGLLLLQTLPSNALALDFLVWHEPFSLSFLSLTPKRPPEFGADA